MVTKFAVSVTEMAKMAGLSRARFYQLVKKGAFPVADKDQISGRSCYLAEKQQQILESRRKNWFIRLKRTWPRGLQGFLIRKIPCHDSHMLVASWF